MKQFAFPLLTITITHRQLRVFMYGANAAKTGVKDIDNFHPIDYLEYYEIPAIIGIELASSVKEVSVFFIMKVKMERGIVLLTEVYHRHLLQEKSQRRKPVKSVYLQKNCATLTSIP